MNTRWVWMAAVILAVVGLEPAAGWAVDGNACVVTTGCRPSRPIGCGQSGPGTNNCGYCTAYGPSAGTCNPLESLKCGQSGPGKNNCGSCTAYGPSAGSCTPLRSLACGASGPGRNACGQSCTAYGPSCPSSWKRYGFAVPEDPEYNFGLPSNEKKDMLALAAKGNIVIGDYTSNEFRQNTLPLLQPRNRRGTTQAYVIDPSDAALGYFSYAHKGKPYFDGDYTQVDENGRGQKIDPRTGRPVGPRRFYESTLPDAEFKKLAETCSDSYCSGTINATLFTNHALTGYMPWTSSVNFFGSMVSRDDALSSRASAMSIAHDIRLLKAGQSSNLTTLTLPLGIKRPKLTSWEECPASGCPTQP